MPTDDIKYACTMVAAATSAGNQDLTISGLGWTPKAVIITASAATTKGTMLDAGSRFVRGFGVGSTGYCCSVAAGTGTGTVRARRAQRLDSILYFYNHVANVKGRATSVGAISDGWRINWAIAADSAMWLFVELFGGDDLEADLHEFTPKTSAGTASKTGLTFQPNLLFLNTAGYGSGNNAGAHAIYSHGIVADNSGGIQNMLLGGHQGKDGDASVNLNTWLDEDGCATQTFNDSAAWSIECTAFNSDGYTMTTTGSTGSDTVHVLALDTGDHDPSCGTVDAPNSAASDWVVNGPGYEPLAFGLIGARTVAGSIGSIQSNSEGNFLFVGGYDGTRAGSVGIANDDGNTDENVGSYAHDRLIFATDADDSDQFDVNVADAASGFDSGGLLVKADDITTADSTQRKWIGWAIEGDGSSSVTLSVNSQAIGMSTEAPGLTQKSQLSQNNHSIGTSSDSVVVTQASQLSQGDQQVGLSSENIAVTQASQLSQDNQQIALVSDTPGLIQSNQLAVNAMQHSLLNEGLSIVQANNLAVQNMQSAVGSDGVVLTMGVGLSVDDAGIDVSPANISLTQANELLVDILSHDISSDGASLTQSSMLSIQELGFDLTNQQIALSAGDALIVENLQHGVYSNELLITQANTLNVFNCLFSSSSNELELTEGKVLVVNSQQIIPASEDPGLFSNVALIVDSITHQIATQNIDLSQASLLLVSDTTFALMSNVVSLLGGSLELSDNNVLLVEGINRDLLVHGNKGTLLIASTSGMRLLIDKFASKLLIEPNRSKH